jgi:hypothetical protein
MHALRLALCLPLLAAAPARAELGLSFVDSSPDRITIQNRSGCDLGAFELVVDLGASPAGLIFDTSGEGAGFAAFAPLEIISGADQVRGLGALMDGDTRLAIELDFLAGKGTVALAVDVDDTSLASELGRTIVSPAEIAGATAHIRRPGGAPPLSATFGPDGTATLPLEACIA